MAKRFIETTIWTQNKWFRKLDLEYKVLWFYLISSCDPVGVWEEDIELASFIIGYTYSIDSLLIVYEGKIKKISEKKYWIVDFCNFQYGILKEDTNNRPHQSYISLLKKHRLYKGYLKTIDSLKEKEQEQDKDIVKDKVKVRSAFIENVKSECDQLGFSEDLFKNFCEYWTEIDYESGLMQYQTKQNFGIKSRLKSWKKLSNENGKMSAEEIDNLKI